MLRSGESGCWPAAWSIACMPEANKAAVSVTNTKHWQDLDHATSLCLSVQEFHVRAKGTATQFFIACRALEDASSVVSLTESAVLILRWLCFCDVMAQRNKILRSELAGFTNRCLQPAQTNTQFPRFSRVCSAPRAKDWDGLGFGVDPVEGGVGRLKP